MSLEGIEVDLESYEVTFDKPNAEFYAQVVFLNVAENYPIDAHVECRYEIRPTLTAQSSDWVGLFKVGWSTVREYVYFHWVKLPTDYQGGRQVNSSALFMCHNLPKDDGEYYQFCYVTAEGLVRGASTPFQFRRPGFDEFVTVEDDDSDILFVTSKTVALEERLAKTVANLKEMERVKLELGTEKEAVEKRLENLSGELEMEKEKSELLTKEKQELLDKISVMENEMKDLTQAQENTQEKVSFITMEKEEILKRLEENEVYIKALQSKIKALLAEKDSLTGKQKMLEEERELYKSHFTSSENTIQGYLREISDLKKSLHDESIRRGQLEQKVPQLEADLEKEKKNTNYQLSSSKSAMDQIEILQEKLKNAEDKLMAVEHCKMMLNEEVIAVHDAHDKMAASLEKALGESHSLKSQICHLEEDNEKNAITLRGEIANLQKQNALLTKTEQELRQKLRQFEDKAPVRTPTEESVNKEEEGAHYALKLAQAHLEKTLAKYKRKYDELKSQIDETRRAQKSQESTEKDLREEIEELKERLAMGAEEYKIKFIECKRLQKEVRKLKKQGSSEDSTPDTPEREAKQTDTLFKAAREISVPLGEETTGEEAVWQKHMETYKRILDNRYTNLYKQELKAQRTEKTALLNKQREDLVDYHSLALKQEELLTKIQRESHLKCQTLKDIISKQRMEIRRLESKDKESNKQEAAMSTEPPAPESNPWVTPSPSFSRDVIDLKCRRRQVAPSAPAWPPSQWLEKEAETKKGLQFRPDTDWSNAIGKRPADDVRRRPEKKLKELARSVSEPRVEEFVLADEPKVRSLKMMVRSKETPQTEAGQLPPPIQPTKLPSAIKAAIKANSEPVKESGLGNIFDRLDQLEISGNEPDHEDERFQDAAGEPQKICPVCTTSFPADIAQFQFEDHVESHYGPVCPVCYKQFPDECELKDYEWHVQSHFNDAEP